MGFLEGISDAATTLDFFLAVFVAVGGLVWWLRTRNKVPKVELTNLPPALPLTGIHMGIEEFTILQRKLRDEARTELSAAHGDEKKRLEEKIDALNARLADPDRALAEQQAIITSLEEKLARQDNQLGGDATAEAKAALEAGDFTKARALFETLAAQTEPDVQTHADAAFALGQIAETEIRWHDAAKHYATAARLNPTFDTLRKASEFVQRAGDYAKALRLSDELLVWARKNGTQTQLSNALNEQATNLRKQGNYPQAEALFLQALEIGKTTIGTAHPAYAVRLNNLAEVIKAQGRYPEAEALYRQALEIGKVTIGTDHPNYAIRLNNLAGVLRAQGRYPEAEALFLQALEIGKTTIGTAHPAYAIRLSNLAGVVKAQGKYPEAEALYLQAEEIGKSTIGTTHPDYATHLNNLAGVIEAQGRYPEAEALFLQALEIDKASIGTAHPDYAIDINNLAKVVEAQGRYPEARGYYARALTIFRDKLGDGHPNTGVVAKNLLSLLQSHFPDDPEIPALQALLAANP